MQIKSASLTICDSALSFDKAPNRTVTGLIGQSLMGMATCQLKNVPSRGDDALA